MSVTLTDRQYSDLLALLDQAARALREVEARRVSQGDREVAELLLPAWCEHFGSKVVTVAELRQAPPDAPLAEVLQRFAHRCHLEEAGATFERKVRQQLGILLTRIDGQDIEGLRVVRIGDQQNRALWVCSPT